MYTQNATLVFYIIRRSSNYYISEKLTITERYWFFVYAILKLHIDPWPSHQSDISLIRIYLCKYAEVVTWLIGNHGCYEMTYADALVSVSVNIESVPACSIVESADREQWLQRGLSDLPARTGWVRLVGKEDVRPWDNSVVWSREEVYHCRNKNIFRSRSDPAVVTSWRTRNFVKLLKGLFTIR